MANNKISSLSVLKNLPPERQADIWERLTVKSKTWQDTGYRAVRKWLHDDGLETSEAALSDFYSWYPLRQQFHQDEVTTNSLLEQLKQEIPGLTEEQLDQLGQRTFSLLAIRRQDPDSFVMVRSARSKAELEKAKLKLREQAESRLAGQAKLAREKFQFDAAKAALKCAAELKVISKSKLSQADKVNQARLKLFGVEGT